jgi:hypothetical protein
MRYSNTTQKRTSPFSSYSKPIIANPQGYRGMIAPPELRFLT